MDDASNQRNTVRLRNGPFSLNTGTPRADIIIAGEFEGSALNTQRHRAIIFRLVALCHSRPPSVGGLFHLCRYGCPAPPRGGLKP
jgi:hypothetical protein